MSRSLRHKSRIVVIQTLFALLQHGGDTEAVFSYIVNEFADELRDTSFALSTLLGIQKNESKLRDVIKSAAPEWPIEKIAIIDLIVLELGIYEILFEDEIPDLVAINEAVDISKEFGGYNNSKFVNGVLSCVMNNKSKYL